jgi:hypothetical protein
VLVLDMIKILPSLGKYKYDTWRIFPVKCYIDNSMHLQSCIRNINTWGHAILEESHSEDNSVSSEGESSGSPLLRACNTMMPITSITTTPLPEEIPMF